MHIEIILFGIEDCPDCLKQKSILEEEFGDGGYKFVDIESDSVSDLMLISKFEIDSAPSIVIIKKEGEAERKFRHVGIISASKMQQFIERIK